MWNWNWNSIFKHYILKIKLDTHIEAQKRSLNFGVEEHKNLMDINLFFNNSSFILRKFLLSIIILLKWIYFIGGLCRIDWELDTQGNNEFIILWIEWVTIHWNELSMPCFRCLIKWVVHVEIIISLKEIFIFTIRLSTYY
jgi:hypothetical protein